MAALAWKDSPGVGDAQSAVGQRGTWVILEIVTGKQHDFYLSLQPFTTRNVEDHGKFGSGAAAELYAQANEDGASVEPQRKEA